MSYAERYRKRIFDTKNVPEPVKRVENLLILIEDIINPKMGYVHFTSQEYLRPVLVIYKILIDQRTYFESMDTSQLDILSEFIIAIIEATHLDLIKGETHEGTSFHSSDRGGQSAYDRNEAIDILPNVFFHNQIDQQSLVVESAFDLISADYFEAQTVDDFADLISSMTAGEEFYRIKMPIQRDIYEAYRLQDEITATIQLENERRKKDSGLDQIIKRIDAIEQGESSTKVLIIQDDISMLDRLVDLINPVSYARSIVDRELSDLRDNIGSEISRRSLINSLKRILEMLSSSLSISGSVTIPVRIENDLIFLNAISLRDGRVDKFPPTRMTIEGATVHKVGLPAVELMNMIAKRRVVYDDMLGGNRQMKFTDYCSKLNIDEDEVTQEAEEIFRLTNGQYSQLLTELHYYTSRNIYTEQDSWRTSVLARRLQYILSEDRDAFIELRESELISHYEELLTKVDVVPHVDLCASGLAANNEAIIRASRAIRSTGAKPRIYESSGWYYENSIYAMGMQDFEGSDIDDSNIFLMAIEPNGPLFNTDSNKYRRELESDIEAIIRSANNRPSERLVLIIDMTAELLADRIDITRVPSNLTIIETASLTKHQRGRQNQFYGYTAVYGDLPALEPAERALMGSSLYGSSSIMFPKLYKQEIEWRHEFCTEQMRLIQEVVDQEQERVGIPEDHRWRIETHGMYCFVIPPKAILDVINIAESQGKDLSEMGLDMKSVDLILNSIRLRSYYNSFISKYWNSEKDTNGRSVSILDRSLPVDKGDSYGTNRIRATLFGVRIVGDERMIIMRISAGVGTDHDSARAFGEYLGEMIAQDYDSIKGTLRKCSSISRSKVDR